MREEFRERARYCLSLALRQAIWRKPQPGWHVCSIPQVVYSDHGNDFTSRHLEQVAADLKIRLINSTVARPRGRGKIERFFDSLAQVLLSRLPGFFRTQAGRAAVQTQTALAGESENYLIREYLVTLHSVTGQAPQARWEAGGNFRLLHRLLTQIGRVLEINKLNKVTLPAVEAARESLVIGTV